MPGAGEGSPPRHQARVLVADGLYAPTPLGGPVAVVLSGGIIDAVWPSTDAAAARARVATDLPGVSVMVTELAGLRLAPGFIDLHIHGFAGYDVSRAAPNDLLALAQRLPAGGTTCFLPTIASAGPDDTAAAVARIVAAARAQARDLAGHAVTARSSGAEIAGIRLEGPFIAVSKKGAQDAAAIRPPDPDELRDLVALGEGLVRMVDFAPEVDPDGALLAAVVAAGLVGSIGHTAASYEQTLRALDQGARHATHLFNAMSPLTHREPGVPGALLTDERATAELIADGVHVAPAVLRLVVRARGPEAVALVTDAMPAAGLADGDYAFLRRTVHVRDGAARLDDGTLAGSTLMMDRAVRMMVAQAGCSWPEAVAMATSTPACIAGLADRKGRLGPGYDADLVALDPQGHVRATWVRGRRVFAGAIDEPSAHDAGSGAAQADVWPIG